jgi:hypothetical protein
MKLLVVSFCILIMLAGSGLAEPTLEPAYALDVRYDAEHRRLDGTVELSFVPVAPTVYLSLLANLDREPNPFLSPRANDARYPFGFETSSTAISSAELVEGDRVSAVAIRSLALPPSWQTYSLDDTALAIDLPDDVTSDPVLVTLRLAFTTEIPRNSLGDQGITAEVLTWRFGWFPTLFPSQEEIVEEDGQIAYAGRESFPLTFPWTRLDATVTVPSEFDLITGTDVLEPLTGPEQEDVERQFHVAYESPARSLGLTIGADYHRYTLDGPIPIEVAYLPGHEEEARFFATLARDILDEYEALYGSYPRAKLTIVENPNDDGLSLAADGIVWLSRRFFTHRNVLFFGALNRVAEYVLAHEIAHQWVGLGTGIDLNAEAWLSEGLAQYLAVQYFEGRYGAFEPNLFEFASPGVIEELVKRQFGFFNLREHFIELPYLMTQYIGFDEALVKPIEKVQFSNVSDVRLYDKGYLVARAIASAIGEEPFERAILRAIDERRADLLDVRTFQSLLEEEAGRSLEGIFDTWVFGPGRVDYAIRIASHEESGPEHVTAVVVTRSGGASQPVDIEVTLHSGATLRQTWAGDADVYEMTFRTPSRVVRATVDPDHRLPDLDRLNNNAPVKIVGGANEAAYPLDAYVLTADTGTGGLTFSYLDRLRVSVAQGAASAQVKLGRAYRLSAFATTAGERFAGGIALTYTDYAQPETGSPATYWEPDVSWTVGVKRLFSEETPLVALEIDVIDHPSFGSSRAHALTIDVTAGGSGRLLATASDELRVFPGMYLQGSASVGFGFADPPKPFRFQLSGLRSFSPPLTLHEIVGDLGFEIPAFGDMPYNLLNLAMVDRMRSRLFLAGGIGWTTLDEFGTTSPYMEAGIEQIIDLSTLGGLLSLQVRLGVATPLMGQGVPVFYARLSL